MKDINEIKMLDKIDELLAIRDSKKTSLAELERIISEGISAVKRLPNRWYVRQPDDSVIEYLTKKYNRDLKIYSDYALPIGLGEFHGEFVLIPHDVIYSWEITQKEFDLAIKLESNG